MNKNINTRVAVKAVLAAGLATFSIGAMAHDPGSAGPGTPTCLESNLMVADAQFQPFASANGMGRVLEMNTTTGERGLTVNNPFTPDAADTPVCPDHVSCGGPFKPTGVLSGGENGHAFLVSAAQHALVEHHRNSTKIRTSPVWPTSPSPDGGNFGFVPRLLGNGFMPNGNIAQVSCNANFFNAPNSDVMANGESGITYNAFPGPPAPTTNASLLYFPPVYSTADRSHDGRVLVVDQNSLEVIDEYRKPTKGPFANDPRWNCPAGVVFTSEGMFVSMFHGDAVFVVDWKAGVSGASRGTGANNQGSFKLDRGSNEAKIIRVIDLSNDGTMDGGYALNYDDSASGFDSGNRRDNLRAIRMSEDGTLFGTRRSRSKECLRGEAPGAAPNASGVVCNPSVFRQHIFTSLPGEEHRSGSIALDPGVNIIAGVTINRMSGPGCKFVNNGLDPTLVTGDSCDVETLYVGVSAGNPGCSNAPETGHPANNCFVPGGKVLEYRIDQGSWDATDGTCTGDPNGDNSGCAQPIAVFEFHNNDTGALENIDPRMVMTVHEAFMQ